MKKFKNLLDQVGSVKYRSEDDTSKIGFDHSHDTTSSDSSSNVKPISTKAITSSTEQIRILNPMAEKEIIESIVDVYYSTETDTSLHEILRLPDNPSQQLINEMRKKLMDQLAAVLKRLSEIILKHQPEYYKELQRVRELEGDLSAAHAMCKMERECLDSVSTKMCLKLLLNYHKKYNLMKLHSALTTIKTLEHTDVKLRLMVENENYPEAIQLCLECQKVACEYRHYKCVTDLSSKLQDTLELMEEQIDVALSKICGNFDENVYAKLQFAYFLLGKTQTAMDQLLMHFTTCVHNVSFQVVLGFAKLCTEKEEVNLHKKQFEALCSYVKHDDKAMYIGCLLALCKSLWNVMNSYHKISMWHLKNFENENNFKYKLTDFDKKYIEQKLKHGRQRVWLDVQSRVKVFLMGADFSVFKYDDFILALDVVKRLILIGDEFISMEKFSDTETSNKMQSLHEPIQKQSLRYFKAHHKRCMEELRMFLENEAWEPCPVKSNFSVLQLPEFKFLQMFKGNRLIKSSSSLNDGNNGTGSTKSSLIIASSFFDNESDIVEEDDNPFIDFENDSNDKNSFNDYDPFHYEEENSDEEISSELYQEYIDENIDGDQAKHAPKQKENHMTGPLFTNTALNILRTCGKYMKMCDVLKPISFDVIYCMSQLFDYYLYGVFSIFSYEKTKGPKISQKLSVTLRRIEEELLVKKNNTNVISSTDDTTNVDNSNKSKQSDDNNHMEIPVCHMLDLSQRSTLYGFYQRLIAVESLTNVANQFVNLASHLERLIPEEKKAFLQQFYSQTVNTCSEVRSLVLYPVAKDFINYDAVLLQINNVNWDIHDIMSQHSSYVDTLLREIETLQRSMPLLTKGIGLSAEVCKSLWEHCLFIINHTIVEGYSNVKKCSNEGRALMQLDFQQFIGKAEKLTNLKPIPGKEFVELYIKAYYMTEEDLESWMQQHTEYTHKQLTALVNCNASSSTNRKNKQKLFSLIEDITRRR